MDFHDDVSIKIENACILDAYFIDIILETRLSDIIVTILV